MRRGGRRWSRPSRSQRRRRAGSNWWSQAWCDADAAAPRRHRQQGGSSAYDRGRRTGAHRPSAPLGAWVGGRHTTTSRVHDLLAERLRAPGPTGGPDVPATARSATNRDDGGDAPPAPPWPSNAATSPLRRRRAPVTAPRRCAPPFSAPELWLSLG